MALDGWNPHSETPCMYINQHHGLCAFNGPASHTQEVPVFPSTRVAKLRIILLRDKHPLVAPAARGMLKPTEHRTHRTHITDDHPA